MAYGFWVLLYNFKKTKRLLYVVVPSVIWAAGNYHFFLLFDIEPWWYGLVRSVKIKY